MDKNNPSRVFLSLRVQPQPLAELDPYAVTTWQPTTADTILAQRLGQKVGGRKSEGFCDRIKVKSDDVAAKRERPVWDEDQVMVLFPPSGGHRQEIKKPFVHAQRTPKEIRKDYLYMELAIQRKEHGECVAVASPKVSFIHDQSTAEKGALLRVESPTFVGKVEPLPASPSASMENVTTYVQSQKLLSLKKTRSGVFINEQIIGDRNLASGQATTNRPANSATHPRFRFDPRKAQKDLDAAAQRHNRRFIVTTDPRTGQMSACIEPCRPTINSKERGTQSMFDQRSIIQAGTHLKAFRPDSSASHAKVVAAIAFLYSKLDDARHWTGDKVDDVIRLGLGVYDKWTHNPEPAPMPAPVTAKKEAPVEFDINNAPASVDFHGFRLQFDILPPVYQGVMKPELVFMCTHLNRCIRQCFEGTKAMGILVTVGDLTMALWRKDHMYFLFDAFARDELGRFLAPSDNRAAGCVLMNNRLSELCEIIGHNVGKTCEENAPFELHEIRVNSVDQVQFHEMAALASTVPTTTADAPRTKPSKSHQKLPLPKKDICDLPRLDIKAQVAVQSSVPQNEMSVLSLVGHKRKRSTFVKRVSSDITSDKVTTPKVEQQETKPSPNLTDVCTEVLEVVLDKIEDKIEQKCIVPEAVDGHRARKVLVKSDLGALQRSKVALHRGLNIDPCAANSEPPLLTLSQETLIASNMRPMPDGTSILHGTQNLLQVVKYNSSICVVAPLLAVVMSYKYGVHTWDSAVMDFILNTTKYVQECVPMPAYALFRGPRHRLPDIQVGSKRYALSMYALTFGRQSDIDSMLRDYMFPPSRCTRVVLASLVYNAAIVRRHNFWYLYEAFPCDVVGIRSTDLRKGTATLQRFVRFTDLVQRVLCNQSVAKADQMFSVNRVMVTDVTESSGLARTFQFVKPPAYHERNTIERLAKEREELVRQNNARMRELNATIKEEKCRIKRFNKKAGLPWESGQREASLLQSEEPIDVNTPEDANEEDGAEKANKTDAPKDVVDDEDNDDDNEFKQIVRQPFGYACVEPDHFFKIQGSTCLPNRFRFRSDSIRACHFCCMYATLMSFNRRWTNWNFRHVDQCIEEGIGIYQATKPKCNVELRCIHRVQLGSFAYQLIIERYEDRARLVAEQQKPLAGITRSTGILLRTLTKFFERKRYVLLQFPNCTFAIVRRRCYNLFDAYASHELRPADVPFRVRRSPPHGVRTFPQKDSAAWLCMPTLSALIAYVRQRIRWLDMNTEFRLYCIKVVSTVPLQQQAHLYRHHLMAFSVRADEPAIQSFEALAQSVPDEQVKWLDARPTVVPWSRRMAENLMGKKRYRRESVWKAFDCELEGELYSLWSRLHPMSAVFEAKYRGRQYAGIYMVAGSICALYPVDEWTQHLMDYIVVEGDRYFAQKMSAITASEYEVQLEDLRGTVELASFKIEVDIQQLLYGAVYSQRSSEFNLKKALLYFFKEPERTFGVLQCFRKSLAFGRTARGQYFMFDCQSFGAPLFEPWQGGAYLLLCSTLRRLLHCMVLTLRVPCYNVEFTVHSVRCVATEKVEPEEEEAVAMKKEADEVKGAQKSGGSVKKEAEKGKTVLETKIKK